MKTSLRMVVAVLVVLNAVSGWAADRYVAQNGQGPGSPYTSWTTAASNVQDAITASSAGDIIWVADGHYRVPTNGVAYNSVTNIVYINKPLTLRGFSGDRSAVIIDGEGIYRGINIAYATSTTNRFVVSGLTVSNSYDRGILFYAGGVNNISWTGVVENCVITDGKNGAGIHDNDSGTSARTLIISNSVIRNNGGAGIYNYSSVGDVVSSVISDCVIEGNTNSGLVFQHGTTTVSRCIIRGNTSPGVGAALSLGIGNYTLNNCLLCTNIAAGVGGAIYKWSATGPLNMNNCTIAGNVSTVTGPGGIRSAAYNPIVNSIVSGNLYNGTEQNIYASGGSTLTNCLSLGYTNAGNISVPAPAYVDAAGGDYRLQRWSSGVDAGITQEWMSAATDLAGQARVSANDLVDMGAYETSYETHPAHYVAQNGQTPVSPYTNWVMAASNIQAAVNAANPYYPMTVWVGAGRYFAPDVPSNHYGPSVVVINSAMTLRSSNSVPDGTIIDGGGVNRGVAIKTAVNNISRCVVDGFTFVNGYATNYGGGLAASIASGSTTVTVQNCAFSSNTAFSSGGGLYAGFAGCNLTVSNCAFSSNVATNADPFNPANNIGGGGLYLGCRALITDCIIASNRWGTATNNLNNGGGGIYLHPNPNYTIRNTLISRNAGYGNGGGIYMWVTSGADQSLAVLNLANCTIACNSVGYGIYTRRVNCTMNVLNSILYTNAYQNIAASVGPGTTVTNLFMYYSLISPTNGIIGALDASNTMTNNPGFVNYAANDFRLAPSSPCINKGSNQVWMTGTLDVGGKPRISPVTGGTVDMGAYEFPIEHGSVFYVR